MAKCLSDNQWIRIKHVLNDWFGGGNRNGKLIGESRNEVCDSAAISSPSEEEETSRESVMSIAQFG